MLIYEGGRIPCRNVQIQGTLGIRSTSKMQGEIWEARLERGCGDVTSRELRQVYSDDSSFFPIERCGRYRYYIS